MWETIEVGNKVVDVLGHERLVLAVLPGVFLLSRANAPTKADAWHTVTEIQEMRMKFVKDR